MEDFGERVRRVREAHDLQQMQIARKVCPVERQAKSLGNYLSRIERGDEPNPSLLMLEQIATGMGLTLSLFFSQIEQADGRDLQFLDALIHPATEKSPQGLPHGRSQDLPTAVADTIAARIDAIEHAARREQARTRRLEQSLERLASARRKKSGRGQARRA